MEEGRPPCFAALTARTAEPCATPQLPQAGPLPPSAAAAWPQQRACYSLQAGRTALGSCGRAPAGRRKPSAPPLLSHPQHPPAPSSPFAHPSTNTPDHTHLQHARDAAAAALAHPGVLPEGGAVHLGDGRADRVLGVADHALKLEAHPAWGQGLRDLGSNLKRTLHSTAGQGQGQGQGQGSLMGPQKHNWSRISGLAAHHPLSQGRSPAEGPACPLLLCPAARAALPSPGTPARRARSRVGGVLRPQQGHGRHLHVSGLGNGGRRRGLRAGGRAKGPTVRAARGAGDGRGALRAFRRRAPCRSAGALLAGAEPGRR